MDRTAIVTGACGSGMGRSTAFCLAREGANVVLNYGTYLLMKHALPAMRERGWGRAIHIGAEAIAFLCSDRARFISGTLVRMPGFPGA